MTCLTGVPVRVDILSQEGDLLDALVHQVPDLFFDGLHWPRPLLTPREGDNAVAAHVVTPSLDAETEGYKILEIYKALPLV